MDYMNQYCLMCGAFGSHEDGCKARELFEAIRRLSLHPRDYPGPKGKVTTHCVIAIEDMILAVEKRSRTLNEVLRLLDLEEAILVKRMDRMNCRTNPAIESRLQDVSARLDSAKTVANGLRILLRGLRESTDFIRPNATIAIFDEP